MKESIVVRHVSRFTAAIVTPRQKSYGSMETGKLEQLQFDLECSTDEFLSTQFLIVDLAGVELFGAQFLRILIDQISLLKDQFVDVIVCGDRTGVLKLAGTDRWVTVLSDLGAALDFVAKCYRKRSQRVCKLEPLSAA